MAIIGGKVGINRPSATISLHINGSFRIKSNPPEAYLFFVDANCDRIGIVIKTPQQALHINNVMQLEPRTTASSSPGEGDPPST